MVKRRSSSVHQISPVTFKDENLFEKKWIGKSDKDRSENFRDSNSIMTNYNKSGSKSNRYTISSNETEIIKIGA